MEDKEVTINAPAHSKSGVRTSKLGYEDHLGTKIVSVFDVAQAVSLQVYKLVCGKNYDAVRSFSQIDIPALYTIMVSLHGSQRVLNASDKTLKRMSYRTIHTEGNRKEAGSWRQKSGGFNRSV
eukprot:1526084-Pleurochrysis_carterae.AAC.1